MNNPDLSHCTPALSKVVDNGGNHQSNRVFAQLYQDLRRGNDGATGVGHRVMADNDV